MSQNPDYGRELRPYGPPPPPSPQCDHPLAEGYRPLSWLPQQESPMGVALPPGSGTAHGPLDLRRTSGCAGFCPRLWIYGEGKWMTPQGASGPKVLDSMCISICCCPLVRASCRKRPGGRLMPHSTATHSPSLYSHGALAIMVFMANVSQVLPVIQAVCQDLRFSQVADPGSQSNRQWCCFPPWWAFPRVHAPDLRTASSRRESDLALNTPQGQARWQGRDVRPCASDSLTLASVPRCLPHRADGGPETAQGWHGKFISGTGDGLS